MAVEGEAFEKIGVENGVAQLMGKDPLRFLRVEAVEKLFPLALNHRNQALEDVDRRPLYLPGKVGILSFIFDHQFKIGRELQGGVIDEVLYLTSCLVKCCCLVRVR